MRTSDDQAQISPACAQLTKFLDSMDGFYWMTSLQDADLDQMLDDVAETLGNGESSLRERLAFVMWDWQATAAVLADPELRLRLSEPIDDPLGEPVQAPID